MEESFQEAKEELKRADHLLYVSLKYTRTVDMFRYIIQRLISTFEYLIDIFLKSAKSKKKIKEIPINQAIKCSLLQRIYPDDEKLKDFLEFYLFLRKLIRSPYTKEREFRRHVTMTSFIDKREVIVNIDILHDYFKITKEFMGYTYERMIKK
jgi:hypothetical protein